MNRIVICLFICFLLLFFFAAYESAFCSRRFGWCESSVVEAYIYIYIYIYSVRCSPAKPRQCSTCRLRLETELSKHLWQLKEANKEFNITWKILAKAKSYTNLTKRCNLCTTEKFFLICRPHMATLNKRNELVSTCRHRRKFILRYNRTCESQRL